MGLVVTITLSYLLAAVRLAGRGILIQRLNAIESLSRVDTVCIDKTGTLTTQRLSVRTAIPTGIDQDQLARLLGDFAANVSTPDRTSTAIKFGVSGPHPACPRRGCLRIRSEVVGDQARCTPAG